MVSKQSVLLYMFLSVFSMLANAQEHNIIGKVKDEHGVGIANAFILLSDTTRNKQNLAEYAGIMETDSLGNFTITKEVTFHKISVSCLGYYPVEIPVTPAMRNIDIVLQSDGSAVLDEVVVKGYKQAVKMNSTGLTYDMKYNPVKNGSTKDALRFIPMVHVEGNSVKIIGKTGVKYFLNGKELKLKGQALDSYIQSIRLEDIETIEVITSYDPRFNLGMDGGGINIVTKRVENEGWKGNVQASLWKTHNWKGSGNLLLSYNKRKFSSNLYFSGSRGSTWQHSLSNTLYKNSDEQTDSDNLLEEKVNDFSTQGIFNYSFGKRSSLDGNFNFSYSQNDRSDIGSTRYIRNGGYLPYAEIAHHDGSSTDQLRVDAGLTYRANGRGKFKLSLNYDYGNIDASLSGRMDSIVDGIPYKRHEHYEETVPQISNVWSLDGSYIISLSKRTTMGFDLHANYWNVDNDECYKTYTDEGWKQDDRFSFHQKTDEWNFFGIVSMSNTWSAKVKDGLGLGMERREYRSEEVGNTNLYHRSLWQPYFNFLFNVTPNKDVGIKYNANYRQYNPSFASMTPYWRYTSASTYRTGNPDLSHIKKFKQQLTVHLFQNYIFYVNHNYVDDAIVDYSKVQANGMIETRSENMASYHDCTAYLSVSNISYLKGKGNLRLTAGGTREWYRAEMPDGGLNNRVSDSYFLQLNNALILFPTWKVQMVNSLSYNSVSKSAFDEYPAKVYFYSSFQKNIRDWSFNLNVFVNAYVNGNSLELRPSSIYDNPELHSSNITKGESVGIRLQIGYTFGNKRVKSIKSSANYISGFKDRLKNE